VIFMKRHKRKRTRIIRVHEGFYKYLKELSELEGTTLVDITRELEKLLKNYLNTKQQK